jgi:hypothetical protein
MLCALTVRRLKPGTFDQFKADFGPPDDAAQQGWVRFHMLRGTTDENEVVTFGFFDGTLEQLEQSQRDHGYADRVQDVSALVEQVISNGVYEVDVSKKLEGTAA